MAIERDVHGMKLHKNIVIRHLQTWPEDRYRIIPDWEGSIEEYIAELERSPGEWFVNGVLEDVVADSADAAVHEFEGVLEGTPDRPCTKCGKADRHPIHRTKKQ